MFLNVPAPISIFLFSFFQTQILQKKNLRLQQDSNLDRRSRRLARWPLDHHHGPVIRMLELLFTIVQRLSARLAGSAFSNEMSVDCVTNLVYQCDDCVYLLDVCRQRDSRRKLLLDSWNLGFSGRSYKMT